MHGLSSLSNVELIRLLALIDPYFTIPIMAIFILLFHIKHFVADFPLQNAYMLGKFKEKDWVLPLATHCGVHFLFTFLIVLWFRDIKLALVLGCFDFTVHFIMDRIKASPKMLGRFQSLTKRDFELYSANVNYLKKTGEDSTKVEEKFKVRMKENRYFWWALGLDQMVHHITDVLIVVGLLLL